MSDQLVPAGNGGLPAPSPGDAKANPLTPQPQQAAPSPAMAGASGLQDAAKAQFDKVKQASDQMDVMEQELQGLAALQDTVTMDDVVDAAATLVAHGIPAVQVASSLAEAPDNPSQLPAWVSSQLQALAPRQAQVKAVLAQAGHRLASAAIDSALTHSVEAHHARRLFAAMKPQGSA